MSVPSFDIVDQRCTHSSHAASAKVYRMSGYCLNCGAAPLVGLFTAGHDRFGKDGPCPACGCRQLRWDKLADSDPATAL